MPLAAKLEGQDPAPNDGALRGCMQALVLLNLVFAQMTGAAGLHWLAPLFALTVGAPLLQRFHERLLYRLLWNGGVVCFFLVLLRHALRADLAYVLEDGLVMAVLCQVHLLNNLRSDQRPDLLFFNAFLIAIITGFMTTFMNPGLGFPLAFLVFAPCFIVGLQLLSATRDGHVLAPAVSHRMVVDGGRRAALVLAMSLGVFVFWPRDFERKAFLSGKLDMTSGGAATLELGFNEKLVLGQSGTVETRDREALRVTLLDGERSEVPSLWRGATLAVTSGDAWRPAAPTRHSSAGSLDERWDGRYSRLVRSGIQGGRDGARVGVLRLEQQTERLFAPLGARVLELAPEHGRALLRPQLDGNVDTAVTGDVRYELVLANASRPKPGGAPAAPLPKELVAYVELPENDRVERARELAARLATSLPADAEQHRVVSTLNDHLVRSYRYLPPGTEGAARSLDEFLRGGAGGHCEFFASALATMLRSRGIPCRVVTGFRSTSWDAAGRVLTFGTRSAHAWVEVHDPSAGWYPVDPSPMLAARQAAPGLLARLRTGARSFWRSVVHFDADRRAALAGWARSLPGRLARTARERPSTSALTLLLVVATITCMVRRKRARTPPAVRGYRRAVRRARLRARPGETPRELLARARAGGLPEARVRRLEAATRAHEAVRYAA